MELKCGQTIPAVTTASGKPHAPPGLLLLGGQTTDGQLSSVETFGFENCSIPPLPETRYGFGSFIAFTHHPTKLPQLAVCGGGGWENQPPQIASRSM